MSNKENRVQGSLQGLTVLVTRARTQSGELKSKIEAAGGRVIEFPVIKTVPPKNKEALDRALQEIDDFKWILFTSTNGVEYFVQRLAGSGLQLKALSACIGAVGPRTALVLEENGRIPDLTASDYKAEGLLAVIKDKIQAGDRVLLPRANIARSVLPEELTALGARVTEADAYDTVPDQENAEPVVRLLKSGTVQAITFTSSSTVTNFCAAVAPHSAQELLKDVIVACIGPVTSTTAEKLEIHVDVTAAEYTMDGLVRALISYQGGDATCH